MTVFTSRIRHEYLKKRSKSSMGVATLLLIAIIGAFSIAASDEQDQIALAEFSPALRNHVVSTWTDTDVTVQLLPPGGR